MMGNEGCSKVLGKGNIEIIFSSGKKFIISNVLRVSIMSRNLASGDLLSKSGIKTVYEAGKLILTKNENFTGKGYLCDGMIKLCLNNNISKINFFDYFV